jgi:hypothetical protein
MSSVCGLLTFDNPVFSSTMTLRTQKQPFGIRLRKPTSGFEQALISFESILKCLAAPLLMGLTREQ